MLFKCGHQRKALQEEVLVDILEASTDQETEDIDDQEQKPRVRLSDKKTNTPQVPSMILIPANAPIHPRHSVPQHQSHCPMSVRRSP